MPRCHRHILHKKPISPDLSSRLFLLLFAAAHLHLALSLHLAPSDLWRCAAVVAVAHLCLIFHVRAPLPSQVSGCQLSRRATAFSARPARCARALEPARWSGWDGVEGGCEVDRVCAGCHRRALDELMPMVSCDA